MFYIEQALKMVMVEMKGKAQDHPTLFAIVSKFERFLHCNSLAQEGDFWAAEFLKEFENTLQTIQSFCITHKTLFLFNMFLKPQATSTS